MKFLRHSAIILSIGFMLSSCGIDIVEPGLVTENSIEYEGRSGQKVGKSEYNVYLLGIFKGFNANRSIYKAAKNGDITNISTVDRRVSTGFLGGLITTSYVTEVRGN
jgi:hypothetical protein